MTDTQKNSLSAVALLEETKVLLVTKGWTQGALARDATGRTVWFDDEKAACFCLLGALSCAHRTSERPFTSYADAETAMEKHAGACSLGVWNDSVHRTAEDVLSLIDKAINTLQESET